MVTFGRWPAKKKKRWIWRFSQESLTVCILSLCFSYVEAGGDLFKQHKELPYVCLLLYDELVFSKDWIRGGYVIILFRPL